MSNATRSSKMCQTHTQRNSSPKAVVLSLRAGLPPGDDYISKNEACQPNADVVGSTHLTPAGVLTRHEVGGLLSDANMLPDAAAEAGLPDRRAPSDHLIGCPPGADVAGLTHLTPKGFLTRHEVAGLLSDPNLLHDAAAAADLPARHPASDHLIGCVVNRQAPFKRVGKALFAAARIRALLQRPRPNTTNSFYWQLALTVDERDEQPTCLAYVATQPATDDCFITQPDPDAEALVSALRGELATRLESVSTADHVHRRCVLPLDPPPHKIGNQRPPCLSRTHARPRRRPCCSLRSQVVRGRAAVARADGAGRPRRRGCARRRLVPLHRWPAVAPRAPLLAAACGAARDRDRSRSDIERGHRCHPPGNLGRLERWAPRSCPRVGGAAAQRRAAEAALPDARRIRARAERARADRALWVRRRRRGESSARSPAAALAHSQAARRRPRTQAARGAPTRCALPRMCAAFDEPQRASPSVRASACEPSVRAPACEPQRASPACEPESSLRMPLPSDMHKRACVRQARFASAQHQRVCSTRRGNGSACSRVDIGSAATASTSWAPRRRAATR